MEVNKFFYRAGLEVLRFYWRISGGRRIDAFGESFHVTHNTIFPSYWKLRLPKGSCLSEIVKYTDFVQVHSLCNLATQLEKPTIVDIGAHHGGYAIILGKIAQRKGGKVIAVEPIPESYAVMVKNVSQNGLSNTVICEQVAILDKPGHLNMELKGVESKLSGKQNDNRCPVTVVTLEQLLQKYEVKKVDLLIIDVEGAELPVLRSFPWQSASVGKIYCELHPYGWKDFGYCGEDFRNFLEDHGYRCIDMYLKEHDVLDSVVYVGPTLFMRT